jgi:uncharacterized protein YegJ (DUF2314 family)
LPKPTSDPLAALRQALAAANAGMVKIVEQMPAAPADPCVRAQVREEIHDEYAPPDIESLKHFGRGLTDEQAKAVQSSEQALVLEFGHPKQSVWRSLRAATEIAEEIARQTGGLLWDEQTRLMFSPDEWRRTLLASWSDDVPDVSRHIAIHAYQPSQFVRAITLGMSKFGLPDVVIEEITWSAYRTMGNLINLFCQAVAEGATLTKPGEFDLDLHAIKSKTAREPQEKSLKANATATALLTLRKGKPQEGDPENQLIEIGFDRYSGPDVHSKQEAMLSAFFGWEDQVTSVKHDEKLAAASQKAKAQLPELQAAFASGLRPGEVILVKAPFPTPTGGSEWMWVEIMAWQGKQIKGRLANEPSSIPALSAGQIVDVNQDDVFDYIRQHPDGRQEGNETAVIIEEMQQKNGK